MPTASTLLAFSAAAVLLVLMPGPSMLFVVGRAVAHGRAAAVRSAVGNAVGAFVLVVAVAVGVGALVAQVGVLFTTLKLVGAGYLVFLGVRAIVRRRELATEAAEPGSGRGWWAVWDGVVVGATNPKTLVFFLAVLPQFVDPSRGEATLQLLVLGGVFVLIAAALDSCSGLLAGTARRWVLTPRRLELAGVTSGVMMIGLGGYMALTGRRA